MTFRTRFAPSPTGPLHLGHAYSALLAYDMAKAAGGEFLLRIEDIDQSRSRDAWERQIYEDLRWLGVTWPDPVMRQSDRHSHYAKVVSKLSAMGLTYACNCKRADIDAAAGAPQEGMPQFGPDGRIYPGTCRHRPMSDAGPNDVIRLNIKKAVDVVDLSTFNETGQRYSGIHALKADDLIETIGDVVLVRRNMAGSYHLSVVIDDADQGITHVVRGEDLFEATRIHVLLQTLLGFPVPIYHHHRLVRDAAGKRLAKRDDARAISKYRGDGASPADIRKMVRLHMART
ncbi:tRNA glutamyl-Q(34) synthetase GluQRS [Lutimaribacter marinistellae]|uniref:tRNA glutamyl-Q(34) synthetase GluQRS n=1 Tax=Lutimaribacter marinistellae TaxID=1820329 RepID=A0ABV7TN04_9RHOB